MAKRFTDTEKWKREWFYDLKPHAKLAWLYLLDQCDHAGIWPRNFRLMSEQLGLKVDHATLIEWFGEKVVLFDGDKYCIPSFFDFQYGTSREGFKARQSALQTLVDYGLFTEDGKFKSQGHLPDTSEQSPDCPSISIGKSNKGGAGGKTAEPPRPDSDASFDAFWTAYPRRKDKTDARKAFAKNVTLPDDLADLMTATANYAAEVKDTEMRFVKHPATFLNDRRWRDYVSAETAGAPTATSAGEAKKYWDRAAEACIHAAKAATTTEEFDRLVGPHIAPLAAAAGGLETIRHLGEIGGGKLELITALKQAHQNQPHQEGA